MRFLRSLPAILSFLVLGAHLLRSGLVLLVPLPLLFIFLLIPKAPWAVRSCQALLGLGALEWLRTLAMRVIERNGAGEPYLRLVLILGFVAAFTAGSALLLRVPERAPE